MLALDHTGGLGSAADGVAGGVEMEGSAHAVGDVREVDQRGGDGAFLDGGVEVLRFAGAQGRDEVGPIVADVGAGSAGLRVASEAALVTAVVFGPYGEASLRAIEALADGVALAAVLA